MAKNDKKIKEILNVIAKKKNDLGDKPRAAWKTNGIFKHDLLKHTNINTITTISGCVSIVSVILQEKHFVKEAASLLEVEESDVKWNGFSFDEWIHDFKLRSSMISWDAEKKKLNTLDKKLSDLRSEDAKTEDAISDIIAELK